MRSPTTPLRHPGGQRRRAVQRLRVLAAAVLVSLVAAACGSSGPSRLNTAQVARAIEQTIQRQNAVTTVVACPSAPLIKTGVTFRCTARLAVGSYVVEVVEISSKGAVRYTSSGPLQILDSVTVEHAIAASLRRQRHLAATVSCPSPVLQSTGIMFDCRASTKDGVRRFAVTEIDGHGHVRIVDQTPRPPKTRTTHSSTHHTTHSTHAKTTTHHTTHTTTVTHHAAHTKTTTHHTTHTATAHTTTTHTTTAAHHTTTTTRSSTHTTAHGSSHHPTGAT